MITEATAGVYRARSSASPDREDPRVRQRPDPVPVEHFSGHARGRGTGTLWVEGVAWPLQHAALELYHCASGEADWNFFAWTPQAHGEQPDSTGVAFHGTVVVTGALRAAADLVGLRLEAAGDSEGWEADYFLADGRPAVLAPADGAVLAITAGPEADTVALHMQASLEGYVIDDAGDWPVTVPVVLECTATVAGLWPARRGGSSAL